MSKQLEGGALTKLKLDNAGIVSVLYEQVEAAEGTRWSRAGRRRGMRARV